MSVLEDYLLNNIRKYTLLVLIQGPMQSGKSTFCHWLVSRLHRKKYGTEWDYKKYCARNLEEFIDIVDRSNNQFIVYEEASKDITIQRHWNDMNLFFNIVMQTQAYKHNLIFLVFPHSASISKQQRYFVNLGIEIIQKVDQPLLKATIFKPTLYKRRFYKLDNNDLYYKYWCNRAHVVYSKKELTRSREYTKWIENTLKKDVMTDIKNRMKHKKEFKSIVNDDVVPEKMKKEPSEIEKHLKKYGL